MSPYIWYRLLNVAGAGRSCARSEIAPGLAPLLEPILAREGYHRDVLGLPLDMVVTLAGSAVEATILGKDGARLAAFTIALRDRGATRLWQDLHQAVEATLASDPDAPPRAPWVGLALDERTRALPRSVVHTVIAIAKASAWTWHDMRRGQ